MSIIAGSVAVVVRERSERERERLRNFLGTTKSIRYRLLTLLVNRALTSVDLSDNNLKAEGAQTVAAALPQCKYVA